MTETTEPRVTARAALLVRYGTVTSALNPCPRERDLEYVLWRLIAQNTPETGGPSLMGWRSPEDGALPREVRDAMSGAVSEPATVEATRAECDHWAERAEVHDLLDGPGLPLSVRARRALLEEYLAANDPERDAVEVHQAQPRRAAHVRSADATQSPTEPVTTADDSPDLANQPGNEVFARSGENLPPGQASRSPDPGTDVDATDPAQPKRTRAEKQAAVRALLGELLTDREIARRVRVSPSTVAAVRRASV